MEWDGIRSRVPIGWDGVARYHAVGLDGVLVDGIRVEWDGKPFSIITMMIFVFRSDETAMYRPWSGGCFFFPHDPNEIPAKFQHVISY